MPDNRLVKKKHLRDVSQDLWDKAKKKFAKLDEPNIFKEENIFKDDAIIESREMYAGELYDNLIVAGGTKKMGRRDYTSHSHGNNGYVKSLVIKVDNGKLNVGAATNVRVWAVEKHEVLTVDHITEIVPEKEFTVIDYGNNWGNCVEIPIEKQFDKETYFTYQFTINSNHTVYKQLPPNDNYIYLNDNENVDFGTLNAHRGKSTVGVYGIIGGDSVRQHIKDCVKTWGDLDYTTEYKYVNMADYNAKVQGSYNGNTFVDDPTGNWQHIKINIQEDKTYTLLKRYNDSSIITFLDRDDTVVNRSNTTKYFDSYWYRNIFKVPLNPAGNPITKVAISFKTDVGTNPKANEIMLIEGDIKDALDFIPRMERNRKVIIHKDVAYEFEPETVDTGLRSVYIDDAIRELAKKQTAGSVTHVNEQEFQDGKVTVHSEHIPFNNDVAQLPQPATNVKEAIEKLKGLIDKNANIYVFENKAEFDGQVGQTITLKDGDIVYFIDSNDVRDYTDTVVGVSGKPMSMIFDKDTTPAGNNLRVFSVEWNHLKYVEEYKRINSANRVNLIKGKRYETAGQHRFVDSPDDSTIFMDVTVGKRYTLYIKSNDPVGNIYFVFTNKNGGDQVRVLGPSTFNNQNGAYRYDSFSVQAHNVSGMQNGQNYKLGISLPNTILDQVDSIMLFEVPANQSANDVITFIPFADGENIQIGTQVSYAFDNSGSDLKSTTYESAIKELNAKIGASTAGISDITYDPNTRTITMTKDGIPTPVVEKLDDLASQKLHENIFEKKSGFKEGYIKSEGDKALAKNILNTNDNDANMVIDGVGAIGANGWWVTGGLKIPQNTLITNLYVKVENQAANYIINNIEIREAEVTVEDTAQAGNSLFTVGDVLFSGKAMAKRFNNDPDLAGAMYVEIPINKRTNKNKEAVLIVKVPKSLVGTNRSGYLCQQGTQPIDVGLQPTITPGMSVGTFYHGHFKVISRDIPFEELINVDKTIEVSDVYGLEGRLANKLHRVNDTATEGGEARFENKVPLLNNEGLIPDSMLPSFTPNKYIPVSDITNETEVDILTLEYETSNIMYDKNTGKRYLVGDTQAQPFMNQFICLDDMFEKGWHTLEHVTETVSFENLYTTKKIEAGEGRFNTDGSALGGSYIKIVVPAQNGKTYRFTSKKATGMINGATDMLRDLNVIEFGTAAKPGVYDNTTHKANGTWSLSGGNVHGRKFLEYAVTNADTTHIGFNINLDYPEALQEVMVWESSQNPSKSYVEGKETSKITIDGDKVTVKYADLTPDIQATELKEILIELAKKPGGITGPINADIVNVTPVIDDLGANVQAALTRLNEKVKDHEHASNKINLLTGYDKGAADTTGALTQQDSLNKALAKLENGLEGKVATVNGKNGAVSLSFEYTTGNELKLKVTGGDGTTVDNILLGCYSEQEATNLLGQLN